MAHFPLDMLAQLPFKTYEIRNFEISDGKQNILATVASLGSFNTFLDLVKITDYEERLKYGGPTTVLAPTDNAFKRLPNFKIEALKNPANRNMLNDLMEKWIIPGQFDISRLNEINKEKFQCGLEVIYPNIRAYNGLIHAVDNINLYVPGRK